MKPFVIIPHTEKYDHITDTAYISYCYLHGELQSIVEFDIFSILIDSLPDNTVWNGRVVGLEEGIYPCTWEDKPCTFYYWKDRHEDNRGLVVLDNDVEGNAFAMQMYEFKSPNL
jgi:hypothetical protein